MGLLTSDFRTDWRQKAINFLIEGAPFSNVGIDAGRAFCCSCLSHKLCFIHWYKNVKLQIDHRYRKETNVMVSSTMELQLGYLGSCWQCKRKWKPPEALVFFNAETSFSTQTYIYIRLLSLRHFCKQR